MDYAGLIAQFASAAGSALTASGQSAAGDAAMRRAEETNALDQYIAKQLRVNAGQAVAQGQHSAEIQELNTKLTMSRALAVAAASGGGAKDPGVITQISRLAGYGAYAKQVALYQGEEAARGMRDKANASEYSGQVALEGGREAQDASELAVTGTALKGASSLFSKYASGGPKASTAGSADAGGYYDLVVF